MDSFVVSKNTYGDEYIFNIHGYLFRVNWTILESLCADLVSDSVDTTGYIYAGISVGKISVSETISFYELLPFPTDVSAQEVGDEVYTGNMDGDGEFYGLKFVPYVDLISGNWYMKGGTTDYEVANVFNKIVPGNTSIPYITHILPILKYTKSGVNVTLTIPEVSRIKFITGTNNRSVVIDDGSLDE